MSALVRCFLLILSIFVTVDAQAQRVQVEIDKIEENKAITGHVTGLEKDAARAYRVVVYAHTDNWYIHPYAGQGEGQTWSSITPDGKWSIETIRRPFTADQVAALVINSTYSIPDRVTSLDNIKNIGMIVKNLRGTPDFGKL